MSILKDNIGVGLKGHVKIIDESTGKVLLDQDNAIHPQNMTRIIARKLANESNSFFYRIAFGNGGTFVDAGSNVTTRRPNDGSNGAGWEARLYREIYSEIIDDSSPNFGIDPGSAGPDNVRVGGKSSPLGDATGLGVFSEENTIDSSVVVNMNINESEPIGLEPFIFDEIGIYSEGLQAINTSGVASIDVGSKVSTDIISPPLAASTSYVVRVDIDGTERDVEITTPASGSGSAGAFTYGDFCEAMNTGSWDDGGTPFSFTDNLGAFFLITDTTGGQYPSISGQDSGGLLTIQSKSNSIGSSISFPNSPSDITIGGSPNIVYLLANSLWAKTNVQQLNGQNAGVINSDNDLLERERLLTHIIFSPITKSTSSIIRIVYTVTVSTLDCIE
jgi:hypothetical protein